jgi:hypothetical protein
VHFNVDLWGVVVEEVGDPEGGLYFPELINGRLWTVADISPKSGATNPGALGSRVLENYGLSCLHSVLGGGHDVEGNFKLSGSWDAAVDSHWLPWFLHNQTRFGNGEGMLLPVEVQVTLHVGQVRRQNHICLAAGMWPSGVNGVRGRSKGFWQIPKNEVYGRLGIGRGCNVFGFEGVRPLLE